MNYAIIIISDTKKEIKLSEILGKMMIKYLYDYLNSLRVDKIVCLIDNNTEYIKDVFDDVIYFYSFKELIQFIDIDGYSIIAFDNYFIIDNSILDDIKNIHLINNNELTIANDDIDKRLMCVNNNILKLCNNSYLDIFNYLSEIKVEYLNFAKIISANCLLDICNIIELKRLNIINRHILNGVKIEGLNNTVISDDCVIDKDCIIKSSTLLGASIIHNNSIIDNSHIKDSIIFDYNNIYLSNIENSIIGKSCMIGPFTNIRGNSMLSGDIRVGNFVEIKNSRIGRSSKLSHLSYMGDCLCGKNVNFGCGSVTVNFDGKNKYQTNIGDDSFIGCNSSLIAPISIGNNCVIGAGSTIVENVMDNSLAIARSRQITKRDYK